MNIKSKFFIVLAMSCVSAAAAYSQDCNNYLRQATELVSEGKYCDALQYYQRYANCNADADVSTEIAMCERRCKLPEGNEGGVQPVNPPPVEEKRENAQDVITLRNGDVIRAKIEEVGLNEIRYKNIDNLSGPTNAVLKRDVFAITYANGSREVFNTQGGTSAGGAKTASAGGAKKSSAGGAGTKLKIGLAPGFQIPTETADAFSMYIGGGISGEFLPFRRLGIGISAGYYTNLIKESVDLGEYFDDYGTTNFIVPVVLNTKFYFFTNKIQPYAGFDLGLYYGNFSLLGNVGDFPSIPGITDIPGMPDIPGMSELDASTSAAYFGLAPVIGIQFRLSNLLALDANIKYNMIFTEGVTTSLYNFNLGLVLKF